MLNQMIRYLAPGLAARRAEQVLRLEIADRKRDLLVQAYDAANPGGRFAGWRRSMNSAGSEIQPAIPLLRASARDLVRNNPYAARAVTVLTAHIVGKGVRPRVIVPTTGSEDDRARFRTTVGDQWERFVENCDPEGRHDFYGIQRLAVRASIESGESLVLSFPVVVGNFLRWRCRVVEGDYLDHMRSGALPSGNRIVQGIEFDQIGARVAYYLFDGHPGDRLTGLRASESRRVPAEFVDHIFQVLRPGQARGVSFFSSVATTMHDVDGLAEAEVVRKKLEACISMIVHNANEDAPEGPAISGHTTADGAPVTNSSGDPLERLQPGMILQARPGWDVTFNAPPASPGLVEHMKERLHAIAAGIGVTYAQMTGDLGSANYSSMRSGALEFERLVDGWQDDLVVMPMARPMWRRVMDAAQKNGDIPVGPAPRVNWTRPARPWIDPQKDSRAAREQMQSGTVSPQEIIERQGRDPMRVLDDIADWQKALDERGISTDLKYGGSNDQSTANGGS